MNNKKKEIESFLFWSLFFFFIIFLTFLFFHSKFYTSDNLEDLTYDNLDNEQMYKITLEKLQPGDIILDEPVSYADRYTYQQQFNESINNRFIFFLYYNLFEFLINSIGEGSYWHSFIYIGNDELNSLSLNGVENNKLDKNFVETYNFVVLRPKVNNETVQKAIERAKINLKNKEMIYSFKNGLLIVFSRSTGIYLDYKIKDNELVCSSYIANLYYPLKFNGLDYKYVTPVDLFDKKLTRLILAKNKRGFYYE